MAKKIENISTADLSAYLRASETIFMKGQQLLKSLNFNVDKLGQEYGIEQANKVTAVQGEAQKVIKEINTEMDRRLKYTFGMKTNGATLDKINDNISAKLS